MLIGVCSDFFGILIFLLLTASDNKKLNSTLNETFDFVKTRIESYEIYNTNDQVKSLVRLMDKTTELSRVIAQEGNFRAEMLDKYATYLDSLSERNTCAI